MLPEMTCTITSPNERDSFAGRYAYLSAGKSSAISRRRLLTEAKLPLIAWAGVGGCRCCCAAADAAAKRRMTDADFEFRFMVPTLVEVSTTRGCWRCQRAYNPSRAAEFQRAGHPEPSERRLQLSNGRYLWLGLPLARGVCLSRLGTVACGSLQGGKPRAVLLGQDRAVPRHLRCSLALV